MVLMKYSCGMFPFRSVNVICVDLFWLIFNLHLWVHFSMLSRWVCRFAIATLRFVWWERTAVSSAKVLMMVEFCWGTSPWIMCRGTVPERFLSPSRVTKVGFLRRASRLRRGCDMLPFFLQKVVVSHSYAVVKLSQCRHLPSLQAAFQRSFLLLCFYFSVFTKDRLHKEINPDVSRYVIPI